MRYVCVWGGSKTSGLLSTQRRTSPAPHIHTLLCYKAVGFSSKSDSLEFGNWVSGFEKKVLSKEGFAECSAQLLGPHPAPFIVEVTHPGLGGQSGQAELSAR